MWRLGYGLYDPGCNPDRGKRFFFSAERSDLLEGSRKLMKWVSEAFTTVVKRPRC